MNSQLRKAVPMILVAVLAILLFFVKRCKNEPVNNGDEKTTTTKKTNGVNRYRGFDRRISFIDYSEHAKCRMDCRKISKSEVEEIMQDGKINYNKSDLQNVRCPRYALEGTTRDDQRVRIIFAQCDEKTTVVTVIDLKNDWICDCPGDDKKYENKK